jgi:hypothetical protein
MANLLNWRGALGARGPVSLSSPKRAVAGSRY